MYKQDRAFNEAKGGHKPGFCLQNVRLGFGIASKYPNAATAMQHTQLHKDRNIPTGVAVPLFYTYKTDGHINVHLPDGRVWSDGNYYANLAAYEKSHPSVHYVGWGESVNDVRVIEYAPDPKPISSSVVGKHITLPADSGNWHLYHENGPYTVASGKWITILHPSTSKSGYTYPIVADKGNGIYVIQSPRWGRGALYTKGSKFSIK